MRAARAYKAKSIFLSGGVAANKLLRKELSVISRRLSVNFFAPPMKYNTDNAAMIGVAAYISYLRKKNRAIKANSNLNI
jgi:N6-L-threonylcarbamoyladenine synthase